MKVDLSARGDLPVMPQLVSIDGDAYRFYRNRSVYMGVVPEIITAVGTVASAVKSISSGSSSSSKQKVKEAIIKTYNKVVDKVKAEKGIVLPYYDQAFDSSGKPTPLLKSVLEKAQANEAKASGVVESGLITKDNKNIAILAVVPLLVIALYSLIKKR